LPQVKGAIPLDSVFVPVAERRAPSEKRDGGLSISEGLARPFTGLFRPLERWSLPMQYMLLIYTNEAEMAARTPGDVGAMAQGYTEFTQGVVRSGNYRAGEALEPTSTATTVRVRDGKLLQTDGPYAETKEQLGGFYIVEAKDLDEATKIAARIPGAASGFVEVRPVRVFAKSV
jgi:hypothetical protein